MNLIKKIIPNRALKFLRPYYHGFLAIVASWYFGNPSSKLIVIGVTGTAGKSTTVQMLAWILNNVTSPNPSFEKEGNRYRAGFITTVSFFDGQTEYINKHGLSMPGGWLLQKQLRSILNNGCKYAVVECTSEGLAQNRHLGIKFDVAVLTNLSEAHIEAHGGFENYRKAKGRLFEAVSKSVGQLVSKSDGKQVSKIQKTFVVNRDDENAEWFLQFSAEKKISTRLNITSPNPSFKEEGNSEFSPLSKGELEGVSYIKANKLNDGFQIGNVDFNVKLTGEFNLYNALLAAVTAHQLGISLEDAAKAISTFTKIRGRMEEVENKRGFKIFVDYGCEPVLSYRNNINNTK
jgi:UDP-N-acetylmuramoyl-L-alanyl-D-glutamate--2,6-diaminopimelate ligase